VYHQRLLGPFYLRRLQVEEYRTKDASCGTPHRIGHQSSFYFPSKREEKIGGDRTHMLFSLFVLEMVPSP